MRIDDLGKYMMAGTKCHLVGIGGVSMSPLAQLLQTMGLEVAGSDIKDDDAIARLRAMGIRVHIGHSPANLNGARFVIRTAAARDDNTEISAARARGIPVFERSQAWGYLMRDYAQSVCVAGTHGKTTTTSMLAHILIAAGTDPTVMIGGTLPALGSGYRVGGGDVILMESCEYYDSFLNFTPSVAVILNIDDDHLDYFKDLDGIKNSFRKFAGNVPSNGCIVCNYDDENTMEALRPLDRELFTFGAGEGARMSLANTRIRGGGSDFEALLDGRRFCDVSLNTPGAHNIQNALAAAAASAALGIPPAAISEGLGAFHGAKRRFEYKGGVNGAAVYDDYAHHPSELRAVLDTVGQLKYSRVILAFQPHTYSRTLALFDAFVEQLKRADVLFLSEIYAAREINTGGVSASELAEAIPGARFCPRLDEMASRIASCAKPGDVILTVGAGDIYKVGESLVTVL
jgi:UDP-N-acetylmuramate--alanine ligase